jgi:hypothetical protein
MRSSLILALAVLLQGAVLVAQTDPQPAPIRLNGRTVTVTATETDSDGFFPKGPASVCLEGPPLKQCYTHPGNFGVDPEVTVLELETGVTAMLFSAASGGVSGFRIHFALLLPGNGKELEDLFSSEVSVSNQSQHAFWSDPAVSNAKFFVTADYVWGPDESHYSPHRYIVSAYVQKHSSDAESSSYWLQDRYMTSRSYDLDAGADVLAAEKTEILARLRRLKLDPAPQHPPR